MNKNKILAMVLSLTLIAGTFSACGSSKTPGAKNDAELEKAPEALSIIDEKDKTTAPDVTAITAGVNKDGKVVDDKGIVDKSGHKIYLTGQKDNAGLPIYTTGKKASNGKILYTKNVVDSFGKQVYYTGAYDKDGKLKLTPTVEVPDYTTNDTPKKGPNTPSTTSVTVGVDGNAAVNITGAKMNYLKYFGGGGMDVIRAVSECKDGGFVCAVYSQSADGDLSGSNKEWKGHLAIVKYNAAGERQWRYVTGGDGEILLEDITELKDGSIVAVGSTSATDTDAPLNSKLTSSVIYKIDKYGKLVWMYSFPSDKEQDGDFASSVDATPDGGFVVGGKANSKGGFFKGENDSMAYLFKFDKNCNLKWRRTLQGSKSNNFAAVSVADNGDVYAVCVTTSSDGDFSTLIKGKDYTKNTVLLKLNKNGDLEWKKNLDGTGNSEFDSVCATSDGGCLVGGSYTVYKRADGIFSKTYGNSDGYLIRYNSKGEVCWARNFGGSLADYIYDVTEVKGGFVIVGTTTSVDYDMQGQDHGGKEDIFIAYINEKGENCKVDLIGGEKEECVLGVCTLKDGSVVTAGWTKSNDGIFRDSKTSNQFIGMFTNYSAVTGDKTTRPTK